MKIALLFLFAFAQYVSFAQTITGNVKDAETNTPLSGVTVYIGNSSRSTTTDNHGFFTIEGFRNSSYELIFSSVGYKLQSISSSKLGKSPLEVILQAKDNMLDPVAVQSYEKDGWNKWGRLFKESFIGIMPFSNQCTIKNKEVIKFRFSKKNNELVAIALEPLIIVNEYLGYRIRYDLEYFSNNFSSNYVSYAGYPSFSNLSNGKHYLSVRAKRREDVYISSLLHFMRALYADALEKEGFQIRKLKKVPNTEKQRADSIFKANTYVTINNDGTRTINNKWEKVFTRDTINYFKALRRQPNVLNILDNNFLKAGDLFVENDSIGKVFQIPDYLYITYPSKLELPEYYTNRIGVNGDSCVTAVISLLDNKKIYVFQDGQYFPPMNVIAEQYWSWTGNMSSMLPIDYKKNAHEK